MASLFYSLIPSLPLLFVVVLITGYGICQRRIYQRKAAMGKF